MIFSIILTIIIATTKNCHAETPDLSKIVPSYPDCNTGKVDSVGKALDSGLRFRLPVLDTIIHNDRKMHLMQEMRKQWIFLLHGHDLQQLFISREKTNLKLIGWLDDSMWETQYLDVQLISWRNYLILVLAFERNLIIYEIDAEILAKRKHESANTANATVLVFEPIQQLTMPGRYRKMFFAEPIEDKILLILAVDDSEYNGRIKTYEWLNTYFEPLEELLMPTLNFFGQLQNYIIVGRVITQTSETILSIYAILPSTMKLVLSQTLTVQSKNPHFVNFREKNYMIACSKNQVNCNIYKMFEDQYTVLRQLSSKDLTFSHFIAGKNFLVGSRDNEVVVVPNARLNCYSSFRSKDADVSSIMVHINEQGENFILLNYVRSSQTLLRIVEIEDKNGENLEARATDTDDEEELKPNPKYHMFEETIGRLRSVLLQHNAAMVVFRKISNVLAPKLKAAKVQYPVTVKAGNIGIVKIVGKDLRSPVQLLKRIEDLGQRFGSAQRSRRFVIENNQSEIEKKPTRLKVQRLRVNNLVYNGNIVEGFHLDAAAKPMPILSIRPFVKTKILNTQVLLLPRRYRSIRQESLGLFDLFEPSMVMRTRQLNVSSINNVPWAKFYDTLFLKNRDKRMEGRLVMQAATKINNLRTPLLNGLVVKNLFNLVEKQVVHSDILIAGFNVSDVSVDTINGLDFVNDVVFSGQDTFIKSPVVMQQLDISGNFFLVNDTTKMERSFDVQSENLQQIYTGKVMLNGTLTLNNLLLEDAAQIFVNGESLAPQVLSQRYLLNKTEQEFVAPVIFGNDLVTTPNLSTNYLNDHLTEQHLLTETGQTNPNDTLLIIFMLAEIQSDLICNAYTSHLANISREAVRHGEIANITGTKIFEGPLFINHLMTLELNDLPVHELVLKSQLKKPLTLKGPKFFEKIQVRNETNIELNLEVNNLNSLPLRELLNYDLHLDNLTLPHQLLATNVVFHKINGISFDEIFTNLKVSAEENLVLHKDLIIEGNAQFSENLEVDLVNNVNWTEYQQSLVRLHEHAVIGGKKRFHSELIITKALNTPTINNLNIEEIFSNVLLRSKPQTITGVYSFDELQVSNMDVTVINDVPTAAFIDTRSKEVEIESDIVLPKLIVRGNIQGILGNQLNFSNLEMRLEELPRKQWRNVHVLGNARWNESRLGNYNDNMSKLAYLERYAVTRTGNHVISGNVKLRRPIISKMMTRTTFPKDIDLVYIASDCLLKEVRSEQVITAPKSFDKPLNMQSLEAAAIVGCNNINNIDILRLNASLYRLSSGEPLVGTLHFIKPPIVGQLVVQGATNGMRSAQIYHAPNQRVPPIKIAELHIDNTLQLGDINDMSFDYFLQNRVTKQGPALEVFGFLTFENLVLNKEILLQSINGIPIDSLILKTSDRLQALTGEKTIEGDLILAGPAHVLRLNNAELIDSYQKSIFKHLNYHFDSLTIDEATFELGLLFNQDQPMLASPLNESQSKMALRYQQRKRLNAIEHDLAAIDNMISSENSLFNNSKHLMYLDNDLNAQILWQQANETIDKSFRFEQQRLSMCERQSVMVQMTANGKRLFLSNVTSSLLHDNLGDWHVKLENFCSPNFGQVRSKITLTSPNFTKSFDLKKFIENVKIFQPAVNHTNLILHAIDLLGKHNEVRLLKITRNKVEDLQSITKGIGKVLKLFQLTQNSSLLISSALIHNYPTLSIYAFSAAKEHFELVQVIDGDYDIIELVPLSAERYHLILSCVHCQRISVFEYSTKSGSPQRYRIYQFIKLNQLIDKLVRFTSGDGGHYLLVLSEHGQDYYHLYKFSHIQGWLHSTYGYFSNIQMALPLVAQSSQLAAGENALLLLCSRNNNCGLVKAYVQQ